MRSHTIRIVTLLVIIAGSPSERGLAQNVRAPRDFDAEIEDALRSAKRAAGFEFLGTLNRICLLPASGRVNTSNNVPRYVRDPSTIPAREIWYADAAKVFDNLYFVGIEFVSSLLITTSDGLILIDTLYGDEGNG